MRLMMRRGAVVAAVVLALACALPAAAQDPGWKDTAEFSFVSTSGNAESLSLGFKNKLWRDWKKSSFVVKLGGIRIETTNRESFVIDDGAGNLTRPESTEVAAENYYQHADHYYRLMNEAGQ